MGARLLMAIEIEKYLRPLILSSLFVVSLLLEKLSGSLKKDTSKFGRALGHVCETFSEYLFIVIVGIVIHDFLKRQWDVQ